MYREEIKVSLGKFLSFGKHTQELTQNPPRPLERYLRLPKEQQAFQSDF